MPKTLLIHGYAANVTAWKFRKPLGKHAGFVAFNEFIVGINIDVFRWGIDRELSLLQSLNPFEYLKLYRDEETLSDSIELAQKLFTTIESGSINKIIAHSVGCRLVLSMITSIGLPQCVTSITFLQADIAITAETGIKNNFPITNYFCPWDQSLIASSIMHLQFRAGLIGLQYSSVNNIFYPLLKPINLHTSPLRDKKLAKKLL